MRNSLNRSLIDNFRNKVINTTDYDKISKYYGPTTLIKYGNVNGKSHWNIICSAMDWITVVVPGIDLNRLGNQSKSNDPLDQAREMMSFILFIDVLFESIKQLHRVFIDKDTIPFNGVSDIFNNQADDNTYFKTIRACFAVHPVNLNDSFTSNKKEKYYAGWSFPLYRDSMSVMIYGSQVGATNTQLHVKSDDLFKFAKTRYEYLNEILKYIPPFANKG